VGLVFVERALRVRLPVLLDRHGAPVAADIARKAAPVDAHVPDVALQTVGRIQRHSKGTLMSACVDLVERALEALASLYRASDAATFDELMIVAELVRRAVASVDEAMGEQELAEQIDDLR
jgi:hypothetical protein